MKKIMFDDKYGLTDSVLQGRKTMTRRMVKDGTPLGNWGETEKYAKYKIGEVLAVAQPYKELDYSLKGFATNPDRTCGIRRKFAQKQPGWNNKMFVSAKFMPHYIRITDIKVERLQDISDEDIMKEGITYIAGGGYGVRFGENYNAFALNPMVAFAVLIDKNSGKGTWESNPYVFSYTFKLLK